MKLLHVFSPAIDTIYAVIQYYKPCALLRDSTVFMIAWTDLRNNDSPPARFLHGGSSSHHVFRVN